MPRTLHTALIRLFLAFATLLLAACGSVPGAASNLRIPAATTAADLRPGDSLNIAILGVPDASTHAVQVDDDGDISLPYIGSVRAAGCTTAAFSQRVRRTYIDKKIYTAVDVSVSVTERYVYVGGQVARPGRIVWTPDLTVSKAIQAAGGFTLYARQRDVKLVREMNAYDIDVELAQRNPTEDPVLTPGDSIHVERSPF